MLEPQSFGVQCVDGKWGEDEACRHTCYSSTKASFRSLGWTIQLRTANYSPLSSDFLFGSDIVCCCLKTDKRCINTVNEYSMEFKWGVKNFWVIRKWASRQRGRKWLDLKTELMLFLCVSRLELDVHAATQLLGNQAVDTYTRDFTRQSYENCCDFIWISLHYLQIVWKVLLVRTRVKWVKYSNSFSGQWIRWQLVSSRLESCRQAGFVLFA